MSSGRSMSSLQIPVRFLTALHDEDGSVPPEDSLRVLQEELCLLGLPEILAVQPSDVSPNDEIVIQVPALAVACQQLCSIYRKVARSREEVSARVVRLESDLELSRRVAGRTRQDLDTAEAELARANERERQQQATLKKSQIRTREANEETRKCQAEMSQRDSHIRAERRKLEQELEKLKERLHTALSSSSSGRESGGLKPGAIHMLNSLQKLEGQRRPWAKWSGVQNNNSGEELATVALRQLEARQEELLVENMELKTCLQRWRDRLDRQLSMQPNDDEVQESQDNVLLQMPFDLVKEPLENEMEERWKELEVRLNSSSSTESTPVKGSQIEVDPSGDSDSASASQELVQLKNQVKEYEAVIHRQEALLKNRLLSSTSRQGQSQQEAALNETRKAKEAILEERQAIAEERSQFFQQRSQFEAERRQLAEAALALSRERKSLDEERWQHQQLLLTSTAMECASPVSGRRASRGMLLLDQSGCNAGNSSVNSSFSREKAESAVAEAMICEARRGSIGKIMRRFAATQLTPTRTEFTPAPASASDIPLSLENSFTGVDD